ncbi:MAG: hypothetical protein ACM34O_09380 [Ignavibacteria bacterium]
MLTKQIISLLMLFLIVTHGIYHIFIFKTLQSIYKNEISERISEGPDEEELVIFNYSIETGLPNAIWIEEHEFRYKMHMYDVVKKEIRNDSVYLYCIMDEKESALFDAMDRILSGLTSNSEDSKKIVNYFNPFYSLPSEIEYRSLCYSDESYNSKIPSGLLEGEHFPESPPPRV